MISREFSNMPLHIYFAMYCKTLILSIYSELLFSGLCVFSYLYLVALVFHRLVYLLCI